MAISHEQVTGLSSVQTPTIPAGTRQAYVQAESQNIRYTLDGTAPSTSNGLILYAGHPPTIITVEAGLNALKMLEESASAKANLMYITGP